MADLPFWINWKTPAESLPAASTETQQQTRPKAKREPAAWRPMTDMERRAAISLGLCRLPPVSGTKRMAGNMADQAREDEPQITDKQAFYLWRFVWTYRRQIADIDVKAEAQRRHAKEAAT